MRNLYTARADGTNDDERKRSTHRQLKRLRTALFIWLISFIVTIIWFSYRC